MDRVRGQLWYNGMVGCLMVVAGFAALGMRCLAFVRGEYRTRQAQLKRATDEESPASDD